MGWLNGMGHRSLDRLPSSTQHLTADRVLARPVAGLAIPCGGDGRLAAMSSREIDKYLAALDERNRSTLVALRQSILEVVPEAEQCISYGMPAFKIHGKRWPGLRRSSAISATCPTAVQCFQPSERTSPTMTRRRVRCISLSTNRSPNGS